MNEQEPSGEEKTTIAVELFNRFAEQYEDKFMDVTPYATSLTIFCDLVEKKDAAVLELACGPGNVTKYLLSKRPDFKITATDLAPNMLERAQKNNPAATFRLLDCRKITTLQQHFDAVMCAFALPYLSKEEALQLIRDAAKMINAGGVIYISTMEDDYSKSGWEISPAGNSVYMHYHQADYLVEALAESQFDISFFIRQDYLKPDSKPMVDFVVVATKKS